MTDENLEIIQDFLVESFESLDGLDQEFIALEENPGDSQRINSIFRTIHTIKGTCGFLGFTKLESLAHVGETLLDGMRAGRVQYDPQLVTGLLQMVDAVRQILNHIEQTGKETEHDFADLKEFLTWLNSGEATDLSGTSTEEAGSSEHSKLEDQTGQIPSESNGKLSAEGMKDLLQDLDKQLDEHRSESSEQVSAQLIEEDSSPAEVESGEKADENDFDPEVANLDLIAELMGENPPADIQGDSLSSKSEPSEQTPEPVQDFDPSIANLDLIAELTGEDLPADISPPSEPVVRSEVAACETDELISGGKEAMEVNDFEGAVPSSLPSANAPVERESAALADNSSPEADPTVDNKSASGPKLADSTLRVNVTLLDSLMNLVGELVLARNQILQFTQHSTDSALVNTCQRLNLITSELQEGVMKTRMQPIANVWNKFPRVVRDIARTCGKEIKIEMEGKETDLDKTILEAIKDPLTHIVRNSADHGIEAPEVRESLGKPREGTLLLRAYHEGGHVIIEIRDDGAGIDPEKLLHKAIEKGVITPEQSRGMSETDIQKLIFHPGFSTAEKITNVSGRGVGMDVVRSNIEQIGGTVDLQSKKGEGTALFIKIPLTLAIVPALVVTCREDRFAIPQVSLLELLRIEADRVESEIETIGNSKFYRLRGNLLPLVELADQLQFNGGEGKEDAEMEARDLNIVVVRAEETDFGLIVDRVHDTEEIVVKPLGRQVKDIEAFSGATIMGDGKVALILDVQGIARGAHVAQEQAGTDSASDQLSDREENDSKQSLLVVQVGADYRFALPLNTVNRLEEFQESEIELAAGREVVQYRGGILPLINLADFFEQEPSQKDGVRNVVVYSQGEKSVGFIVDEIVDIINETVTVHLDHDRNGIQGSAILKDGVTDLLDINAVLKERAPRFFEGMASKVEGING